MKTDININEKEERQNTEVYDTAKLRDLIMTMNIDDIGKVRHYLNLRQKEIKNKLYYKNTKEKHKMYCTACDMDFNVYGNHTDTVKHIKNLKYYIIQDRENKLMNEQNNEHKTLNN